MIIDAHMHIWNRIDGCVGGERRVLPLGSGRIQIGEEEVLGMPAWMTDCAARAEYVLGEFDAAGVAAGVVVQEYLDGPQNDYLQEVVKTHPDRFFVHGLADFFRPDEVVAESFALFDRGFRGLKICGGHLLGKARLDDARWFPVWERMQAEGFVLAVDFSEGEDQVAEFENVMAAFPQLRVAIGHFGMPNRGGWPGQLLLCRHENVYIECGGLVWLYRHEGYPFPDACAALTKAADEVGGEKLMWGSDWPRTMVDYTYRQSLEFVGDYGVFEGAELAGFLGGNAARLYAFSTMKSPEPMSLITEG